MQAVAHFPGPGIEKEDFSLMEKSFFCCSNAPGTLLPG